MVAVYINMESRIWTELLAVYQPKGAVHPNHKKTFAQPNHAVDSIPN